MSNIDMLIDQLTAKTQPTIVQISTDKLHPFPAHPFKVQPLHGGRGAQDHHHDGLRLRGVAAIA